MTSIVLPLIMGFIVATSSLAAPQHTKAGMPQEPLVFRIIPQDSTIASGAKFVTLDVELLNTTRHVVRLSPSGMGAQIGFSNRACSLTEPSRTQITSRDPWPEFRGKIISIPPGGTYRRIMKLDLDPEFFSPGIYTVTVMFSGTYGSEPRKDVFTGNLESNQVLFEIAEPTDEEAKAPATRAH